MMGPEMKLCLLHTQNKGHYACMETSSSMIHSLPSPLSILLHHGPEGEGMWRQEVKRCVCDRQSHCLHSSHLSCFYPLT